MSKSGGEVKETTAQKELARIASEQNDYGKRYRPLEMRTIADTMDGADEKRSALNMAGSTTQQAFGKQRGGFEAGLSARSGGPGSGAFRAGERTFYNTLGASQAAGLSSARQGAEDARLSNLMALTRAGQGQSGVALTGLGQMAEQSGQRAQQDALSAAQAQAGLAQVVGQAGGYFADQNIYNAYRNKPSGEI